jgi:S-adenosylmethionine decarboxylase
VLRDDLHNQLWTISIQQGAHEIVSKVMKEIAGEYHRDDYGLHYAGIHVTLELWGAESLDDEYVVSSALRESVEACGANLLELRVHRFSPQGLTGVAILSESHMSIHCWPENAYAAVDIFTCGDADPHKAIPVLRNAFNPDYVQVAELKRGIKPS